MLMRYVKIISLTLIFFLIVISPALLSNSSGDTLTNLDSVDVAAPNVVITLHDRNATVHVAPWDSKMVQLNGSVSVTSPPGVRVEVNLAPITIECFATAFPGVFIFQGSGEEKFHLKVRVSEGKSCKTICKATVYGYWSTAATGAQGQASPEEGVSANIYVAPYYFTYYNCPKAFDEVAPGAEADFELWILNVGNNYNTYHIELMNEQELADKGFRVTLSESRIEVPEDGTGIVTIHVQTPSGTRGMGMNEVLFKVNQEKGENAYSRDREYSVDIKIPYEHIVYTTEFHIILAIIIIMIIVSIILIRWRMKKKILKA
jgi:hypothetical protein